MLFSGNLSRYCSLDLKNSYKTFRTNMDFPIPKGPEININSLSFSSWSELIILFNSSNTVLISCSLPRIKILGSIESTSIFPSKSNFGLSLLVLTKEKCG